MVRYPANIKIPQRYLSLHRGLFIIPKNLYFWRSENSGGLPKIFQKCLGSSDLKVKVSSIPAIVSFLLSAGDIGDKVAISSVLKHFHVLRESILTTTADAIQTNEDLAKIALESLTELSKSHASFW